MAGSALPRRLSVNIDDKGFNPDWHHLLPITVWLDGVEQRDVETYDMDEGMIVRAVRDADGRLRLDGAGDAVLTEVVRGEVRAARTPRALG